MLRFFNNLTPTSPASTWVDAGHVFFGRIERLWEMDVENDLESRNHREKVFVKMSYRILKD
jgi:hypothetical protein